MLARATQDLKGVEPGSRSSRSRRSPPTPSYLTAPSHGGVGLGAAVCLIPRFHACSSSLRFLSTPVTVWEDC